MHLFALTAIMTWLIFSILKLHTLIVPGLFFEVYNPLSRLTMMFELGSIPVNVLSPGLPGWLAERSSLCL